MVIANPVSGYTRTVESDPAGNFQFFNVPFNPYSLTVTESGFQNFSKAVQVNSAVGISVKVASAGSDIKPDGAGNGARWI